MNQVSLNSLDSSFFSNILEDWKEQSIFSSQVKAESQMSQALPSELWEQEILDIL